MDGKWCKNIVWKGTVSTISKDDACREQEGMKRPEFSLCDSINYRFSPS